MNGDVYRRNIPAPTEPHRARDVEQWHMSLLMELASLAASLLAPHIAHFQGWRG